MTREIEVVKTDPEVMKIVEKIISQNETILNMNYDLLKILNNPIVLYRDPQSP